MMLLLLLLEWRLLGEIAVGMTGTPGHGGRVVGSGGSMVTWRRVVMRRGKRKRGLGGGHDVC